MSLLSSGYYALSWLGAPFFSGYLKWRAFKRHESKIRFGERMGRASQVRPERPLLWVHAVSVGEAVAALAIIQAILKKHPNIHVLLTTTTSSSAKIIEKRLPKNTTHQFCPVDTPQAVSRFLDYWQPDLAIWIESELWPNLISETQERGIPTILLNGRISLRSFSNWKKLKGIISPFLSRFDLCAVQSEEQRSFFQALGAENPIVMGNVKVMMAPQAIDSTQYNMLKKEIGKRPFWLAASTHQGEEELIFKAHKMLQQVYPDLLTILIPRHVERGAMLQQMALKKGIAASLRTKTSSLRKIEMYIADTLGEMSLFYALSSVVVMGATFVPKGGHNPIEAAQKGAFVLHGKYVFNNPQLYDILSSLGLSERVQDENSISQAVLPWLKKQKNSYEEPSSLKIYREEGLRKLMKLLSPYLTTLREETL